MANYKPPTDEQFALAKKYGIDLGKYPDGMNRNEADKAIDAYHSAQPASENQLYNLRVFKIEHSQDVTFGEARDLIFRFVSSRMRGKKPVQKRGSDGDS